MYYSIKNVSDFEDIFKLIDTNTKIIKIGYAEVKEFKENGYPIIPLVLKTEDKEFMYYYMNDEKIIYEIK